MSELLPHQQRVVDEYADLSEKIDKLAAFFGTETYKGMRLAEKVLLSRQLSAMTDYQGILAERISLF